MTINGLPLHPLVVHATVVTLPVTAFVALAYLRPKWQHALRWPLFALAVLSAVLIWITSSSGDSLNHDRFASATGLLRDRIHSHETWAGRLQVATYIFAGIAAVLTVGWNALSRIKFARPVLLALLAVGSIAVIVLVIATGDAGARAAWGQ